MRFVFVMLLTGLVVLPANAQKDSAPWERPRLAVIVSVDQLRADYFTRFHGFLPPGGLRRLMGEGAWFPNAHYAYGSTYTAPGHAVIATGAYAHRNGIIANKLIDAKTRTLVDPAQDASTQIVGLPAGLKVTGFSPNRLVGTTIGDELRRATGMRSKVVSITLKPSVIVMMAGKLGRPIWFNRDHGRFVSSTHYGAALPAWVTRFNARAVPDGSFGTQWKRRGPKAAYALAHKDDAPWEGLLYGLGRTFPHPLAGQNKKRDGTYYRAWTFTPHAMKAQLELVGEAISAEGLGADAAPDLIGIGVSTFDFAGHTYGPYSHEMVSLTFDLDDFVRDLFALLDQKVGAGRYIIAFTADHGVTAVPEHNLSIGIDAGRLQGETVVTTIEKALDRAHGRADWVLGAELPHVWLNPSALKRRRVSRAAAQRTMAAASARLPGVARVYTKTDVLAGALPDSELSRRITRSFHPDAAGDVYILLRPGWLFHIGRHHGGTRHGTPYTPDTHVPLVFWGPQFTTGIFPRPVEIVDLAPTLATVLAVSPPSLCEGRPLTEALRLKPKR